jgi:hypothetical protein
MRSQVRTINQNKATISFLKPKDVTLSKEQVYYTVGVLGLIVCFILFAVICYKAFASLLA